MRLLATLIIIFFTSNTFAIDKFFLECSNAKKVDDFILFKNEEDVEKVYFFYQINGFTGYYSTYKEDFVIDFDNFLFNVSANQHECKFKLDEDGEYYFQCKSELTWFGGNKSKHKVRIQKQSLELNRELFDMNHYTHFMKCTKGDLEVAEQYIRRFEKEFNSIKEKIKKGNPNNQI